MATLKKQAGNRLVKLARKLARKSASYLVSKISQQVSS